MTNDVVRMGRLFKDGGYTGEKEWVEADHYRITCAVYDGRIEVLRGNLSLAEEGLAAATQEITELKACWAESLANYVEQNLDVERLRAVIRDMADATSAHNKYVDRTAHAAQAWPPADEPVAPRPNLINTVERIVASNRTGCGTCATVGEVIRLAEKSPTHTPEDDFRHFLSYSKLSGVPHEADLRLAYYAGADKGLPTADPFSDPDCATCNKHFGKTTCCKIRRVEIDAELDRAEKSSEVPTDAALLDQMRIVFQNISAQVELDPEAKAVLYGNLKRLYRR
jgi:hypothetical protein